MKAQIAIDGMVTNIQTPLEDLFEGDIIRLDEGDFYQVEEFEEDDDGIVYYLTTLHWTDVQTEKD